MTDKRMIFIGRRVPTITDPRVAEVLKGETFLTEDTLEEFYKHHVTGDILRMGGGANPATTYLPATTVFNNTTRSYTLSFDSNYIVPVIKNGMAIRFLTTTDQPDTEVLKVTFNNTIYSVINSDGTPWPVGAAKAGMLIEVIFDGTTFRSDSNIGGFRYFESRMAKKADLDSPALTGVPTAPTPVTGTNNTQIQTTAGALAQMQAFGLGQVTTQIVIANIDDTTIPSGFYKTIPTTTGTFPTGNNSLYGTLLVERHAANESKQTYTQFGASAIGQRSWVRTYDKAAALWKAWREVAFTDSPALSGIPTAPTAPVATNTTQLATTAFVQAVVAAVIDSSPEALNTLKELATALGNDPNFATTMINALALKAPLDSPLLTGDPKAPTPPTNDNDTSIATTAFVRNAMNLFGIGGNVAEIQDYNAVTTTGFFKAPSTALNAPVADVCTLINIQSSSTSSVQIANVINSNKNTARTFWRSQSGSTWSPWREVAMLESPAFTGNPTAPTAANYDNSVSIATTAFVQKAMALYGLGSTSVELVTDCNAVVNTGMYRCSTAANAPITGVGTLLHISFNANGCYQEYCQLSGTAANVRKYWRAESNGTWSAWREVAALDSPSFNGTPTAPTAADGDLSLKLANTNFVKRQRSEMTTKDVSGNTDVTLTADEAGLPILWFTGALTGNISIILPAARGSWIIYNRTTGAYTLTFKTSTSTQNVVIVQGKQAPIICGGSNLYRVVTDLTDIDLDGTPTAPTPAVGTNTRQIQTTAGAIAQMQAFGLGMGNAAQTLLSDIETTATPVGFYRTNASSTGTFPTGASMYGMILIERYWTTEVKQTYSHTGNNGMRTWSRSYRNSDNTWTAWREVAFTDSPALTGIPTAPTPSYDSRNTQIATTGFVSYLRNGIVYKSITGGNVNLTEAEASASVIILQGTLTSNATVTTPIAGTVIYFNRTAGSFTLGIKGSTATTVSITQGRQKTIFCNGTDVFHSDTEFTDVFLNGTPQATTPAVGTNSNQVQTTAGALAQMKAFGLGGYNPVAAANFNNLTTAGLYYVQNPTNGPDGFTAGDSSGNGYLLVQQWSDGSYCSQIFMPTQLIYNNIYWRRCVAGTWTSWFTIVNSHNAVFTGNPVISGQILNINPSNGLNGAIELGSTSSNSTPLIDWHTSATGVDYNARIIASSPNDSAANGDGQLRFIMAALDLTSAGNVTVPTAAVGDSSAKAASTAYVRNELGNYGLGSNAYSAITNLNLAPVGGIVRVEGDASTITANNWPNTGATGTTKVAFIVQTFGTANNNQNVGARITQIATEVFGAVRGRSRSFIRVMHDANWFDWNEIIHSNRTTHDFVGDPGNNSWKIVNFQSLNSTGHISLEYKNSDGITVMSSQGYNDGNGGWRPRLYYTKSGSTTTDRRTYWLGVNDSNVIDALGPMQVYLGGYLADSTGAVLTVKSDAADGTGGLTVNNFAPTLALIDRSASTYSARLKADGGVLYFEFDNANNGASWNPSVASLTSGGEFRASNQNNYRIVYGSYGAFWRNDGANFWLMLTNSGDQYGSYNNLRPFRVNFATGKVVIDNGLETINMADGSNGKDAANTAFVQRAMALYGLGSSTLQTRNDLSSPTIPSGWYFYNLNSTAGGSPPGIGYGVVLVSSNADGSTSSGWANQMFFATNGKIFFRNNINNGGWSSWQTFAMLESPAFTGTPTVPTPPQFDVSGIAANTNFVNRALGNFRYISGISSNTTLSVDHAGGLLAINSAGITITLPPVATMNSGANIKVFANFGTSSSIIKTNGSETMSIGGSGGLTSFTIYPNQWITLTSNGGSWFDAEDNITAFTLGSGDSSNRIATTAFVNANANNRCARFASNTTWTCPAGISYVYITGCGGGGGGGGSAGLSPDQNGNSNSTMGSGGGGGGGAGEPVFKYGVPVVPGQTYTIIIGGGGNAGAGGAYNNGGSSGGNGGQTQFRNSAGTSLLTLGGGGGGGAGGINGGGGSGGYNGGQTGEDGKGGGGDGGQGAGSSFGTPGTCGRGYVGNAGGAQPGQKGIGFGGGGGGGGAPYGTTNQYSGSAGGAGAPGFMFIEW